MSADERELRNAILGLAGVTTAVADQAQAMTDAELADRLLTGRWSTIEVHEAGRRLAARSGVSPSGKERP
jgi:ribonuclease HI